MSHRNFNKVQAMRKPDAEAGKVSRDLKKTIEKKYNIKLNTYWEFQKWSTDHLAEFWVEYWDYTGIIYSKKYDEVIDLTIPMSESPEWFKGARLNYAENLLKYRDDRVAVINSAEDSEAKSITFAEMYEEASLIAAAFRKLGIKKGDVVACYISNRKEAISAMQAAVSIGAIWTGAVPLLGVQAVLNRFKQVSPKVLLTIDRFRNDNEEIEMLEKVKEIVDSLPSIEKVLIVPSKKESKSKKIKDIRNSCFLDDFLKMGYDEHGSTPPMEFEQVSFSHPVFINFTSGTTGLPKAMMHGFGALMTSTKEFYLQLDGDRNSIYFSMSPVGWVSWNMVAGLSFCGSAIFLYEGVPYYLTPTYFWEMVEKYKLTHLFLPSSVLHNLENLGYVPTEGQDLSLLKTFVAGGSIVKDQSFEFVYNKIKKDTFFSPMYGSTEIIGICLMGEKTVTVHKGENSVPVLGCDIQCVDETGNSVEGENGELIIAKPYPMLLLGLWGDLDGSLRRKAYYSKFGGKFSMGDIAIINPVTKGYIICGRSDDTLKQRGTRFGSSEIYNVVDLFPEVRDSLCVAQYNKDMDERAVLFLQMKEGHLFDEDLVERIRKAIAKELTSHHIPEVILETKYIPYNINGKKLEIIVKKIINKRPYNSDNVVNMECLSSFCDIPELQDF